MNYIYILPLRCVPIANVHGRRSVFGLLVLAALFGALISVQVTKHLMARHPLQICILSMQTVPLRRVPLPMCMAAVPL